MTPNKTEILDIVVDSDDAFWNDSAPPTRVVRAALQVRAEDWGRYLVSIIGPHDDQERFMTPQTIDDKKFFGNGLEDKTFLSEAFALYESASAAKSAIAKWPRAGALLYQVSYDAKKMRALLNLISTEVKRT